MAEDLECYKRQWHVGHDCPPVRLTHSFVDLLPIQRASCPLLLAYWGGSRLSKCSTPT